jgi:tRNA modification GTPase
LTELRKLVEAAIDFPDEEIDFASHANLEARLREISADFEHITAAARQGALLREGLNVVIAGKPNAGKSSLLNRLAGEDVAIVTHLPGTTRDVLRQSLQVDGLTVNLIDTAGLRTTRDVIEAEGVRRARGEIRKADLLLYVTDALNAGTDEGYAAETPAGVPLILVVNKIDLLAIPARIDAGKTPMEIHLSAKSGEGLELLRAQLKQVAGLQSGDSGALSARRRHLDALARAEHQVLEGAQNFRHARALELFAEDLRLAQGSLSEITGEFGSEQLLGEIFRSFCIGK